MICVEQNNTKTCVLGTGVVWLVLPAVISLNYHLALVVAWLLHAKCMLTTLSIHDMYIKHKMRENCVHCILQYLPEYV